MDSFKLYLPSNVSPNYFPNNTASDYDTHLQDPIRLEGAWEVGAESIAYSSMIGDREEKATVTMNVKKKVSKFVNDVYKPSFVLNEDNTWKGFQKIRVPIPAETLSKEQLMNSLNACNGLILKDKDEKVFEFYLEHRPSQPYPNVVCEIYHDDFILVISPETAKMLGYVHIQTFWGKGKHSSHQLMQWMQHPHPRKFSQFYISYINTNVIKFEKRIIIKAKGKLYNQVTFLKIWNDAFKPYQLSAEWTKDPSPELILRNHTAKYVFILSRQLRYASQHMNPIFNRKTHWGWRQFRAEDEKNQEWYVNVYSSKLETTLVNEYVSIPFELQPRLYTVIETMDLIRNFFHDKALPSTLGDELDSAHTFDMLMYGNHLLMRFGKWINMTWSENLSFLFGFDQCEFKEGSHLSSTIPATLDQREQHMFIMADFIAPVSYGNVKYPILQDFIHNPKDNEKIIEKRFQPISYVPITRNYISNMKIRLVNKLFHPVTMKDVKTLLILHFRKIK